MLEEKDFDNIEEKSNKLYEALELLIIIEIAKRIAKVGYKNTKTYNSMAIILQMGILNKNINKIIKKYNIENSETIKNIFVKASNKTLKKDIKIYKMIGINPKEITPDMKRLVERSANKTIQNLISLTGTTASTSQIQFIEALNKAYLETSTGIKSYTQAINDVVKKVSKQGAIVQYPSGAKRSLESATRSNILTATNQMSAELQLEYAEKNGYDLFEVTAHSGARPEHAEWQGKVYTKQELYDKCGYGTITGLCGINCKHNFSPYYKGSTRTYSNKELKDYKNEKVTYNGKEISKYNASQMQRAMERNIRNNKKEIAGLQGILLSNNKDIDRKEIEDNLQKVKNKLKQNNSKLNDFVKQTDSKKDYSRLII